MFLPQNWSGWSIFQQIWKWKADILDYHIYNNNKKKKKKKHQIPLNYLKQSTT